jgi:hypothetical protein
LLDFQPVSERGKRYPNGFAPCQEDKQDAYATLHRLPACVRASQRSRMALPFARKDKQDAYATLRAQQGSIGFQPVSRARRALPNGFALCQEDKQDAYATLRARQSSIGFQPVSVRQASSLSASEASATRMALPLLPGKTSKMLMLHCAPGKVA